jgi:hypothetical protein
MNAQHLYHWTEGGNAITNFDPAQTHIYARAIDEFGDRNLYIGPPTPRGLKSDRALRIRGEMHDLSDFWAVFDEIKAASTGSAA